MSPFTIYYLLFALTAFAANSLLCRLALRDTTIDAASFTNIRLLSGAITLSLLLILKGQGPALFESINHKQSLSKRWLSASALFVYASAFSFSYRSISAGTGALLLFGAVQVTMIGYAMWSGDRYNRAPIIGFILAAGGLAGIVLPGVTAPPLTGALLMILAGIAWGVYSLRGKNAGDPVVATTKNFLLTLPFITILEIVTMPQISLDLKGIALAIASGAITSALGYVAWYSVLGKISRTSAATLQLTVPVIAALSGVLFLGEELTMRLIAGGTVVLVGVYLTTKN